MKKLNLTLILIVSAVTLFAQNFNVPNYSLVKAEDYTQYETDIVNCVNWLMKTPISDQISKRKEANTFLIKWLTGSPNVHIEIKQEIVTFMTNSPELLIAFMGGWAKYSLESKDFDNKIAGTTAGIESVIQFYTKNKASIPKDKSVEKYIKMKKKGTLKEYIEKNA